MSAITYVGSLQSKEPIHSGQNHYCPLHSPIAREMQLIYLTPLIAALLPLPTHAASDAKATKPCTIHSPSSGSYYDLSALSVQPLHDGKKAHKDDRSESWHARGYDYPVNFTLNFCAPVIEDMKDVVGVEKRLWRNVSAFYELDGKTYSIG